MTFISKEETIPPEARSSRSIYKFHYKKINTIVRKKERIEPS
jgi:hypothetical protein